MSENIAEFTLNPKTKRILNLTLYQKHLRFKCKQCALFCCKLGGPPLTDADIERIKQAGYAAEDFLEPTLNDRFTGVPGMLGNLKNNEDGSCVLLKFDAEKGVYKCSIYDVRPILCRLYPFNLEETGPNSFRVKLIPCCKGLNSPDGELVNEQFIANRLLASYLAQ